MPWTLAHSPQDKLGISMKRLRTNATRLAPKSQERSDTNDQTDATNLGQISVGTLTTQPNDWSLAAVNSDFGAGTRRLDGKTPMPCDVSPEALAYLMTGPVSSCRALG